MTFFDARIIFVLMVIMCMNPKVKHSKWSFTKTKGKKNNYKYRIMRRNKCRLHIKKWAVF